MTSLPWSPAIRGASIDYVVDEQTGRVITGSDTKTSTFTELWHFIRTPLGWVLNEIDQEVNISDLMQCKSFSEVFK